MAGAGMLARLGGMVWSPRATLLSILRGGGDGLEPVGLAFLCVAACYPLTVARYAMLAQLDVMLALNKLFAVNGFVWTRLVNEAAYCGVAAGLWWGLGLLTGERFKLLDALNAGLYLFVPMGTLMLVGAGLARAGLNLPVLPQHPLDGWWVLEGNQVHLWRFYLKLGVEMAWPTGVGLATAAAVALARRRPEA